MTFSGKIPFQRIVMKRPRFVLSLTTNDNDYQMEQATAAQETANRLKVDLEILYADNDAIQQSQQLLKIIQSNAASHPDGIIFEPVGGTAFPQVAKAAAAAGIGWVVLNREVEYVEEGGKNPFAVYAREGERCRRCRKTKIERIALGGRSTFYCPRCQK